MQLEVPFFSLLHCLFLHLIKNVSLYANTRGDRQLFSCTHITMSHNEEAAVLLGLCISKLGLLLQRFIMTNKKMSDDEVNKIILDIQNIKTLADNATSPAQTLLDKVFLIL